MDQPEFSLEIRSDSTGYQIRADSPYRDAVTAEFVMPWDTEMLDDQLYRVETAVLRGSGRRRSTGVLEEQVVRDFGIALFAAAFPQDIRDSFHDAVESAREAKSPLRLKIEAVPAELAALPWEFLYDEETPDYVVLSKRTPMVRHLSVGKPTPRLTVDGPLRILGMTCSPAGLPKLEVEEEQRRINEAVQPLVDRGLIEMQWVKGQSWRQLQEAMEESQWHVFHFVGHGQFDDANDEGVLALADDSGMFYGLRSQQLARLIGEESSLRLVVLNACEGARGDASKPFSSMAATLVQRGLPAVLAMQYEISDASAVEFSRKLYESLADARPLDVAVSDARLAMSLAAADSFEWATPVLFMRAMEGALFNINISSSTGEIDDMVSISLVEPDPVETPDPVQPTVPVQPPNPVDAVVKQVEDEAPVAPNPIGRSVPLMGDSTASPTDTPLGDPAPSAPTPPIVNESPAAPAPTSPAGGPSGRLWRIVAFAALALIALFVVFALFNDDVSDSDRARFVGTDTPIAITDLAIEGNVGAPGSVLYEFRAPEGTTVYDISVRPSGDLDARLVALVSPDSQKDVDDNFSGEPERIDNVTVADDGTILVRVAESVAGERTDGAFTLIFQPVN